MEVNRTVCDGRYLLVTTSFEMRMSHWVDAPAVRNASTGATVLDLSSSLWDLWSYREEAGDLVLVLRKYPGTSPPVEVRVLPEGDAFRLGADTLTRAELLSRLDAVA